MRRRGHIGWCYATPHPIQSAQEKGASVPPSSLTIGDTIHRYVRTEINCLSSFVLATRNNSGPRRRSHVYYVVP